MDDDYYKVELVGNLFEVSAYVIFQTAYKSSGFIVPDEFVDEQFGKWLNTQELPAHVVQYCNKVLNGKIPFVVDDQTAILLA